MADTVTCNLCGGTEFHKEAGHYYCKECQTQSQEIIEHVFEGHEDSAAVKHGSSKRIRTEKKVEDQLTSWECYNYILVGLVNELIEMGADAKLKQTVQVLWFKYLSKLEVVTNAPEALPKLAAVNVKMDAEIVYHKGVKRKRSRSRTTSPTTASDISTANPLALHQEKARRKRSLVLAEYDDFSTTLQSEDVSLHNQSLTSLKSPSDSFTRDRQKYLLFNRGARKELLKVMTKNHLKTHCRDINSVLNCHKLTYRNTSSNYIQSAGVLSRNKMYGIIYLGLLINKDKIQLGDMLRFIREGSLSYYKIDHFFPEDYEKRHLNIKNWSQGNTMLFHYRMRTTAAKLAQFIGVSKYIPRQNLAEMCQRYCAELNLPDEVWGYTLNLMSRALPKMQLTARSKAVPNFEGRVMSMIMFTLKLMFGLDEVTEHKLSEYAEHINNIANMEAVQKKMFVWEDWAHYIQYRKRVLMKHHFPTQYLFDHENVQNTDPFVEFMTEHNLKHENHVILNRQGEVLKNLLEKLKNLQRPPRMALQFMPTLTPFRDYVEVLMDSRIPQQNNYLTEVLNTNFKRHSFDFLTHPFKYLQELNKNNKVGVKHRGANNDLKLVRISNLKVKRESWRYHAKKSVFVRLCDKSASSSKSENREDLLNKTELEKNVDELRTREIIKNFEKMNMASYRKGMKKMVNSYNLKEAKILGCEKDASPLLTCSVQQTKSPESEIFYSKRTDSESQMNGSIHFETSLTSHFPEGFNNGERLNYMHYNPYDRYWLRSINVSDLNKEQFEEFFAKFPDSFKLLLNECARITEQHPKDLCEEFIDVEMYLCYVAHFCKTDKQKDNIVADDLRRLINKTTKNW